jgi:hypothetical protein
VAEDAGSEGRRPADSGSSGPSRRAAVVGRHGGDAAARGVRLERRGADAEVDGPAGLAHGRRRPFGDHAEAVARDRRRAAHQHAHEEAEVAGVGAQRAVEQDRAEQGAEDVLDGVVGEAPRPQEALGAQPLLILGQERLGRPGGHLGRQGGQPAPVGAPEAGEAQGRDLRRAQTVQGPVAVHEHRTAADGPQVAPRDPHRPHQLAGARIGLEDDLEAAVHGPPAVPDGARPSPGGLLGLHDVHRAARLDQAVRAGQAPQAAAHDHAIEPLAAAAGWRGHRGAMVPMPSASGAGASSPAQSSTAQSMNVLAVRERALWRCQASAIRRGGSASAVVSTTTWSSFGSTASAGMRAAAMPAPTSPWTVPLSSDRNTTFRSIPRL